MAQEKKLYIFTQDCQFDDPQFGTQTVYKDGDQEYFYPKQVKFMRHAVKLAAPDAPDAPAKKKK